MITALVEYDYAVPQKLPATGAMYHYNRWFEQIDCANHLRINRTTTHYTANGEIVDANEYPVPKYTPEQIKLLAQPNDGVIREVCKRVGASSPKAEDVAKPAASVSEKQPETQQTDKVINDKAATPPKTDAVSTSKPMPQKQPEREQADKATNDKTVTPSKTDALTTPKPTPQKQPEKAVSAPEKQPESPKAQSDTLNETQQQPETEKVARDEPSESRPPEPQKQPEKTPEPPVEEAEEEYEEPPLPDDFWIIGKENLPEAMH